MTSASLQSSLVTRKTIDGAKIAKPSEDCFCLGVSEVARGWQAGRGEVSVKVLYAVNYDPQRRVQCSPGRWMNRPACKVAAPRDLHSKTRERKLNQIVSFLFFLFSPILIHFAFSSEIYVPFHTELQGRYLCDRIKWKQYLKKKWSVLCYSWLFIFL